MRKFFWKLFVWIAVLAALWVGAALLARTGFARRYAERKLGDALDLEVTAESSGLEFPFRFALRKAEGRLADGGTVFSARSITEGCCWTVIESPVVTVSETASGKVVPAGCHPVGVWAAEGGCPKEMLQKVLDETASRKNLEVRNAVVSWKGTDGTVKPVFVGLNWTVRRVCLGKFGRVPYSEVSFVSIGGKEGADGRPNDGRGGAFEWLGAPVPGIGLSPCGDREETPKRRMEDEPPAAGTDAVVAAPEAPAEPVTAPAGESAGKTAEESAKDQPVAGAEEESAGAEAPEGPQTENEEKK